MITTVVLEFGKVLAYPAGAHWFVSPNATKILGAINTAKMMANILKLGSAFEVAFKCLDANPTIQTEQDECTLFNEFYRILLLEFGITKDIERISTELAKDYVYNDERVKLYDDTLSGISEIKQQFKVVVLSYAWPSLRRILTNNGIVQQLNGLLISSEHGVAKGSTKIFDTAVSKFKLSTSNCLFVDDSAMSLQNAITYGFKVAFMDRDGRLKTSEFPLVKNLSDVLKLAKAVS